VIGDYEPTKDVGFCDSEMCQWAMNTKGKAVSQYDAASNNPIYESSAPKPAKLQAFHRGKNNVLPHIPEKRDTFGFFTNHLDKDYFIGDKENQDDVQETANQGSTTITQVEPKLDVSVIAAGLALSPADIEAIMTGKLETE